MVWWRPWRLPPGPSRVGRLYPAISRAEGLQQPQQSLKHLGPLGRQALLGLINATWRAGRVIRECRQAVIVPIPKAGKDSKKISGYRPISITSHITKIAERVVAARLTHLTEEFHLIPPR